MFGCDDTAQKDFLNKRKIKGNIGGPGQSNSNLWFVSPERIDQLGPTNASGSVWMNDTVVAGQTSDPFCLMVGITDVYGFVMIAKIKFA